MTKPFTYSDRKECFCTRRYKGHYIHSHVEVMSNGDRLNVVSAQNDDTGEVVFCKTYIGAQRLITQWTKQ